MKRASSRRTFRAALAALAVLVLAGWLLPSFLSVERYRRFLRNGLEADVGRRVTFDSLSFHLLPRPEFVIRNVVIDEDPRFGIEPFARIERVDCGLRWTSLWRGRLSLSGLDLERPSFNIVRAAGEGWNVENLLHRTSHSPSAAASSGAVRLPGFLTVSVEDGRVNFKMGGVTKPFMIDNLNAQFFADPATHALRFDLAGTPSRTDLMVPSPGRVEVSGVWSSAPGNVRPLTASLRLRDSLLYSWLPLITGRNPEIYGLIDGDVAVAGTLDHLKARGRLQITQIHRWESLPPTRPVPVTLQFAVSADRDRQQLFIGPMNVTFAAAHLHLTGSLRRAGPSARMDLVLAVQNSRLDDLLKMASQLSGRHVPPDVAGDVDGLLTIRGSRGDERFAGFLGARNLVLRTPAGNFPVPQVGVRIDQNAARLMPVRIRLAPHFSVTAEGYWGPETAAIPHGPKPRRRARRPPQSVASGTMKGAPVYRVTLSSNAASLREVVRLARSLGIPVARRLDVTGLGSGIFALQGKGWPPSRPETTGRIELARVQLVVPGLTEPLKIPEAQVQVSGDHVAANPVVLMMGESKFSGSLDHEGSRRNPWRFKAHCDRLTVEEAAQWFEALGHPQPGSLLDRIPGLASLASRLQAGRDLLSALNASGSFQAHSVSYHHLILGAFQSQVQIANRMVRISDAKFALAGGKGLGSVTVDLRRAPARVATQVALSHIQLATLASHLPTQLRGVRGFVSANGDFTARGLSRPEMDASLTGRAEVELHRVIVRSFDPVQAAAAAMNWGRLVPVRADPRVRFARFDVMLRNGKAVVSSVPFNVNGAKFSLGGSIEPGGNLNLTLIADLSHVTWRPAETGIQEDDPKPTFADFLIQGPYFSPTVRRGPITLSGAP